MCYSPWFLVNRRKSNKKNCNFKFNQMIKHLYFTIRLKISVPTNSFYSVLPSLFAWFHIKVKHHNLKKKKNMLCAFRALIGF